MKKVLALIFALVLVLSLAACQSEEDIKKEKVAVEAALQGGWGTTKTIEKDSSSFNYVYVFDNGKVYFNSQDTEKSSLSYTDKGTYEVYPKSKEIICTVNEGNKFTNGTQRKLTYKYESSKLSLYDEDKSEYKKIYLD